MQKLSKDAKNVIAHYGSHGWNDGQWAKIAVGTNDCAKITGSLRPPYADAIRLGIANLAVKAYRDGYENGWTNG